MMVAMGFAAFSQLPYTWVSNVDPGWNSPNGPLVWRPGCSAVTTNCSGNYGNNLNSSYISPVINATCGNASTIAVTFTAYGNTDSGRDFLYIEYSLNDGVTWINPYGAGVGFSGSFGSFPGTTISPIILNATSNIRFQFTFQSNGSINSTGVKITDFDIVCNLVLPVEMASFTGKKVGSENQLNWVTLSERNNNYFDIEWSIDPEAGFWTSISKISAFGNGNSDLTQNYSTVHSNPAIGKMNYYRITQVDKDGTRRVFDEMTVVDNSMKENSLKEIVNLMGQKVNENTPGLVIYIYEDGTKVKKYH
ncbi:hypothetical protein D3C71_599820 [compost metagenome]